MRRHSLRIGEGDDWWHWPPFKLLLHSNPSSNNSGPIFGNPSLNDPIFKQNYKKKKIGLFKIVQFFTGWPPLCSFFSLMTLFSEKMSHWKSPWPGLELQFWILKGIKAGGQGAAEATTCFDIMGQQGYVKGGIVNSLYSLCCNSSPALNTITS